MKATISFDELNGFVQKKTGQNVTLGYVSPDTVKVTYSAKMRFVPPVSIDVQVLRISGNDVELAYSGKALLRTALDFAKELFSQKLPDAVTWGDNSTVSVNLLKVKGLERTLNDIDLRSIAFDQTGAETEIAMKQTIKQ